MFLSSRLADILAGWAQQHQDEQRKQTEENQQKEEQKKQQKTDRRKKVGVRNVIMLSKVCEI